MVFPFLSLVDSASHSPVRTIRGGQIFCSRTERSHGKYITNLSVFGKKREYPIGYSFCREGITLETHAADGGPARCLRDVLVVLSLQVFQIVVMLSHRLSSRPGETL